LEVEAEEYFNTAPKNELVTKTTAGEGQRLRSRKAGLMPHRNAHLHRFQQRWLDRR